VRNTHHNCTVCSCRRDAEIRAELEEEISELRSELAAAEKQVLSMAREREELLETLGVSQDAVAAANGAAGNGAAGNGSAAGAGAGSSQAAGAGSSALQREKAMIGRERDRLKSRVGLLTGKTQRHYPRLCQLPNQAPDCMYRQPFCTDH
jgi:hypothetical protein